MFPLNSRKLSFFFVWWWFKNPFIVDSGDRLKIKMCFQYRDPHYEDKTFLHERLWLSPWIKSISNELDINCHVFASQLSGHCDVIANRLWRHQQNVKRARHITGIMCEDPPLSVIYGFVLPCATRELNTKITLSWAHKQFATRLQTLFSMFHDIEKYWHGTRWLLSHICLVASLPLLSSASYRMVTLDVWLICTVR